MRAEYDLRGGVRGKYYERYRQGTNVVLLEPDVAQVFRDSATVNEVHEAVSFRTRDASGCRRGRLTKGFYEDT